MTMMTKVSIVVLLPFDARLQEGDCKSWKEDKKEPLNHGEDEINNKISCHVDM